MKKHYISVSNMLTEHLFKQIREINDKQDHFVSDCIRIPAGENMTNLDKHKIGSYNLSELFSETTAVIIPVAVDGEENLQRKPGLTYIDGPPVDGKCECCGKHISQLQPYQDDGYFKRAYLIKSFRPGGPYNKKAEKAVAEAKKGRHLNEAQLYIWLTNKYGAEKGKNLYEAADAHAWVYASWECKDCVVLGEAGYFAKRSQRIDT